MKEFEIFYQTDLRVERLTIWAKAVVQVDEHNILIDGSVKLNCNNEVVSVSVLSQSFGRGEKWQLVKK